MTLPQPSGEFHWTQEAWGSGLRCAALLERASHVFTTRALVLKGVPGETAAAWAQAAAAVGASAEQLVRLRQVHGARVVEAVRAVGPSSEEDWPEADVSISDDPQMGLVVRVADCVPVLMADSRTGAVAACMPDGRAPVRRRACRRRRRSDARTARSPRTSLPRSVRASDPAATSSVRTGGLSFRAIRICGLVHSRENAAPRLVAATRDQLLRAGVMDSNIHDSRLCTACHTDVFCSYRKERDKTGRMVGVIRAAAGRT